MHFGRSLLRSKDWRVLRSPPRRPPACGGTRNRLTASIPSTCSGNRQWLVPPRTSSQIECATFSCGTHVRVVLGC